MPPVAAAILRLTCSLLLAVAFVLLAAPPATGDSAFLVTTTDDAQDASLGDGACDDGAGNCTLRAAIEEANALPGVDKVDVPAGTYLLTLEVEYPEPEPYVSLPAKLFISDSVSIVGAGPAATIVDAQGNGSVFLVDPYLDGISVDVSDLTIRGGSASYGGAVANTATSTLALTNVILSDNLASAGGGLWNQGTARLTSVEIVRSGNGMRGSGGGIDNAGTMTLANVTIADNTAQRSGGGIINEPSGTMTIGSSSITDNDSLTGGGGIINAGLISLTDVTVSGNQTLGPGGGLANDGTAELSGVTISGNQAGIEGGGILNAGILDATNVTISGNSGLQGGGLHLRAGTTRLRQTTIAGNVAGADFERGSGSEIFVNGAADIGGTIIGPGTGAANCSISPDPAVTPPVSAGYNLDSDGSCRLSGPGDISGADPRLGPLGDNGGPTQTHALLPGSPAIDAAVNCPPPATDQRGADRPRDGDGDGSPVCDIGAYELELAYPVSALPRVGGSPAALPTGLKPDLPAAGLAVLAISAGLLLLIGPRRTRR